MDGGRVWSSGCSLSPHLSNRASHKCAPLPSQKEVESFQTFWCHRNAILTALFPSSRHVGGHKRYRTNRIRSSVKGIGAFFPLLLRFCHPKTSYSAETDKIKRGGNSSEVVIGSMDPPWESPVHGWSLWGTRCRKHMLLFGQGNTASAASF